jgi:hypothetical protein
LAGADPSFCDVQQTFLIFLGPTLEVEVRGLPVLPNRDHVQASPFQPERFLKPDPGLRLATEEAMVFDIFFLMLSGAV